MGVQYDQLWNKSRMFMEKAIQRRNGGDYSEFQLWASLSLELLGKATLSFIHPSLVVDPNDPKNLLIACGYLSSGDCKTITAKTVFDRLNKHLRIQRFDQKTMDFCMRLANMRNSELHSGELPFEGTNLDHWLPKFWDTCSMLLEFQNKTLIHFVGSKEAKSARVVMEDRTQALLKTIEARIENCKQTVLEKYEGGVPTVLRRRFNFVTDDPSVETLECPACESVGIADGELISEGEIDIDPDDPWIQTQTDEYRISYFRCQICGLILNSYEEVVLSGLDGEYERTVELEPDYEPDYGND